MFAITFAVGVVTGIPLEFQFGTNWAAFSNYAGAVIGQALAMEGVFAFLAESVFLGLFLLGRRRLGPRLHWFSAPILWVGSWTAGFFIIATNAWMQDPVATSDQHARKVAPYQSSSFAAMEALSETQKGTPLVIIGTPDTHRRKLESAIEMPKLLSFLTSRRWDAKLTGLDDIRPRPVRRRRVRRRAVLRSLTERTAPRSCGRAGAPSTCGASV